MPVTDILVRSEDHVEAKPSAYRPLVFGLGQPVGPAEEAAVLILVTKDHSTDSVSPVYCYDGVVNGCLPLPWQLAETVKCSEHFNFLPYSKEGVSSGMLEKGSDVEGKIASPALGLAEW